MVMFWCKKQDLKATVKCFSGTVSLIQPALHGTYFVVAFLVRKRSLLGRGNMSLSHSLHRFIAGNTFVLLVQAVLSIPWV